MTRLDFESYEKAGILERLTYFLTTLSETNRTAKYFINYDKAVQNTQKFELELNTLNYLIGKQDIKTEALNLFFKQPQLLRAVPALIASREDVLNVLKVDDSDSMKFYKLDFKDINTDEIEKYVDFLEETGLLKFISEDANRSLVDYVYGVEAGLDTNARKNRSGKTMEAILERQISQLSMSLRIEHKAQASPAFIKSKWGISVPVDKSERRFDEAVFDPQRKKLWLLETNYYGGGGSKLKAVAGEFTALNNLITSADGDITFVWVTDGQGWKSAHIPMGEAFSHIENIFNLEMLRGGFLTELLSR